MNLNRTIKNLFGNESHISFPTRKQLDELPKKEDGSPDLDFLPRETVRNVLLNCLAQYATKDRKDIFYVQTIAQSLLAEEERFELKDKFSQFLIEVVYEMTLHEEKDGNAGVYYSWVTSQVLEELGVKNNIEE